MSKVAAALPENPSFHHCASWSRTDPSFHHFAYCPEPTVPTITMPYAYCPEPTDTPVKSPQEHCWVAKTNYDYTTYNKTTKELLKKSAAVSTGGGDDAIIGVQVRTHDAAQDI